MWSLPKANPPVPPHAEHAADPAEHPQHEDKIAVALSGGGHRACLFALGALLYLVDAGRGKDLASVASVSGGSLANGAVAQSLDLTSADSRQFESVVARVAHRVTGLGTLFGAPLAKAYVIALAVAAIGAVGGPWFLPLSLGLRVAIFLLAILALAWLASLRGRICAKAFASTLFTVDGRPDRLDSICDELDHVFCATDLHAGEHVYFSQSRVVSFRFGTGIPGDIELSTVVQASAAFPGAFPVSWQPTARHEFSKPKQAEAAKAKSMALVDGGVYDNMADQWARPRDDLPPWLADEPGPRSADELIVVNASAGLEWSSLRMLRLPVIGELLTLLRDKDILYDNGNSLRRQELVSQFKRADRDGDGLRGALVHIPQSPFKIPKLWEKDRGEKGERARAVLAALGRSDADRQAAENHWERVAAENQAVKTTLFRLEPAVSSRLLRHAYVLAMANLHVLLDYPLLPVPDVARFDRLVQGGDSL